MVGNETARTRKEGVVIHHAFQLRPSIRAYGRYARISLKIGNEARSLSKGFDKKKALKVEMSYLQELSRVWEQLHSGKMRI
jgi:hypothetical protein